MAKMIGFMRMLLVVALVSPIVFGGMPAKASVLEQTKEVAGFTGSIRLPARTPADSSTASRRRRTAAPGNVEPSIAEKLTCALGSQMSAYGTKRTFCTAVAMSAFGGKADSRTAT